MEKHARHFEQNFTLDRRGSREAYIDVERSLQLSCVPGFVMALLYQGKGFVKT